MWFLKLLAPSKSNATFAVITVARLGYILYWARNATRDMQLDVYNLMIEFRRRGGKSGGKK